MRFDAEDPQRVVLPPLPGGGVEVLPAVVHVVRAVRVVVADVPGNVALTVTCHVALTVTCHVSPPDGAILRQHVRGHDPPRDAEHWVAAIQCNVTIRVAVNERLLMLSHFRHY